MGRLINKTIGFVGLGNMGSGMAANLLKYCIAENHQLIVFDINPTAVEKLVKLGAQAGSSVAELARQCDVVFTSLPSSKEVTEIAFGDQGLLANMHKHAVWFETSTNELASWQAVQDAAPANIELIDAPVTGGAEGAAKGSLTILLGGDASVVEQHSKILESFAAKVVHMGPAGAGYVTKLCQLHLNYLVAQGIGEALMLGAKAELDLSNLYEVLQNSCAQSYVVDSYIPKVLDGSYDPSFTLGLAAKDMRLITGLGRHLEVPLALAESVNSRYAEAVESFGAEQPHLQIVKLIEQEVGLKLRGSASSLASQVNDDGA